MTPEEILLIFREAKDKNKQIRILADLNMCHWSQIVEVLRAQGVKITYAIGRKSSKSSAPVAWKSPISPAPTPPPERR